MIAINLNDNNQIARSKIEKCESHLNRLILQIEACRVGSAGRVKKAHLKDQVKYHTIRLNQLQTASSNHQNTQVEETAKIVSSLSWFNPLSYIWPS
ncbi:hypothetical protein N9Y92_00035 [Chlamydiales bacterium]|nr:hypothetical protein [Chlamydiales bacterium]